MKRLTMATGIAMVACMTGLADVQHGLMGRYWRKTAVLTADQRASVTDWRAFKSLAESGTLVTEQLMDNSAGFILDDSSTMNIPAELHGNADEANHWIGLWDGSMIVSASGSYGFRIECDDDGLLAVDGCNVTQTTNKFANSAYINLSAGVHRIFIGLYENTHGAGISVYVRMPNGTEQALPLSWLVPDTEADVSSGSGTLSPDPVLTVSANKGVSSWVGTLDGTGALSKVGDSEFDTKWANGSLVAAQGQLATMTSGTADNVLIGDGATVAFVKGGTAKNLAGGGTLATGVHVYGFKISTDADCGISSAKTYTHKVNVCGDSYANGVSPVATVNGVTFDNFQAAKDRGQFTSSTFTVLTGQGARSDPQVDDSGLRLLLRTLSTVGRVNWINIGGLTPGKVYDFRMYYRPYGNSDRNFIHNFQTNGHVVASIAWNSNTDGGVTNSDPNITTGYSVVGCRYVAGSDGRMVLSTQKVNENDNNGYHIYAFTNEEVADGTGNVTLSPDADNAFNGEITGGASVTVSGTGVQTFGGGISTPLAVTGTVILDGGAAVTGGVTVAQGGVLEMRPGSMAGALTGAGTLRLAHGEGGLRGALQADGTFSAPAFPQRVFFTGDDDCGISSGKRYAHAWNFGTNTEWATIVNGAQFAPQIPRDTTPKDGRRFVNLSIPSCGGGVQDGSFIGGMNTTFADTEVLRILHGMCYGGQSNSFNFYGLEAGKDYEVRFYNRAWGSSSRQCIFTCNPFGDGDVQYDFNENDSATPSYVAFRFRPSGTMFSVVGSTRQSGDYPHFYAATVEEVKNYSRIVNADVDAEFSGAVMGNGALLKRGSGVQTLSGAVAATGPWTVEAGGLNLANASASLSNVAVMAGATFGGFGRVTGDVGVAAGGHLALGASGALHVGGNVVMASGSALDVAFNSDGTGTGSLSVVGTLAVPSDLTINLNGAAKPKTRDSLITASGGITGNTSGWVVKGASGKVISKAKIIVTGNKLTLSLDRGMVIILR